MTTVIEYVEKVDGVDVSKKEESLYTPDVFLPSNLIGVLNKVGGKVMELYNCQFNEIKTSIEKDLKDWWICGKPISTHEPVTVGYEGDIYTNGKITIDTEIPVPEFFMSLRGNKKGGNHHVEDLLLVNSKTSYFWMRGHVMKRGVYDRQKPIPELFEGHFHPPTSTKPKKIRHLPSLEDVYNMNIGKLHFLYSMESGENAKHTVFMKTGKQKIAMVPYKVSEGPQVSQYMPSVEIKRWRYGTNNGYDTIVRFSRI